MNYTPRFTDRFLEDTKRLKGELKKHLENAVKKIINNPLFGKPLSHSFKGFRNERVGRFRIIYEIEKNIVIFHTFEHRKKVYG
ncbi:MAG: type II toxin-antitoxin system RelE/ParE family toxin [Candidatus Aenigmarchaeota archaeon]|nr:type II toxin-antitoxin system RelE/ParE family toxin [Candidatus Aenigmarchaeota archaeon]